MNNINKKSVLFWTAFVAVAIVLIPMFWGTYHKYFSEDAVPVQQASYAELRDAPVGSILLGTRGDGKEVPLAVVILPPNEYGVVRLTTFKPNVPGALSRSEEIVQTQGVLIYKVMGDMPTRLVRVSDPDYPSVKCDFIMMTSHLSKARACPEENQEEPLPQQQTNPSVSNEAAG